MPMPMESLLFLSHRLPYPPNKGDKVRSYHFFRHLGERYRLHLGTFIDDPADEQHLDAVRALCASAHVEPLAPWTKRLRGATGLFTGEAMTLPCYRSAPLARWVREVVGGEGITRAFAFSSAMAQYALDLPGMRTVVDFVDVDSAKWDAYARRRAWPVAPLFRREAQRLLASERAIAARAEASIFVTDEEADLFRTAAPESAARVVAIGNGVDTGYFSPEHAFASPFGDAERAIVFTGAMDYWPNIDAVLWFAHEALPIVRAHDPAARFYVVGMNPDPAVRALAGDASVVVTGRVDDVRPYLHHARVVVAPLRVARGIQNKVLEAMAMAKPVVVTPAAASALPAKDGVEVAIAADAASMAADVLALMDGAHARQMGQLARARVLAECAWSESYERLDRLLDHGGSARRPATTAVAGDPRRRLAVEWERR